MARVKRAVQARKHRKNTLKHAKGYKWGRKSKFKAAKDALRHAWTYAFRDRKAKKRDFRQNWQIHINSACRKLGITYSRFIDGLKKKGIELNRKILSEIAEKHPEIFEKIVQESKK